MYFLYDCQEGENTTLGYSKALDKKVEIENALLKPLLMGDSFHRYDTLSSTLKVLFPYYQGEDSKGNAKMYLYEESTLKKDFPKGYAYLKKCEKILRAREKGRFDNEKWYQFGRAQGMGAGGVEKLLMPYACKKSQFAYDKKGMFYTNTKVFGLIRDEKFSNLDYRFLMAILNSEFAWWYMTQVASVMRGGYYTYIQDFAIPSLEAKEQKPLIDLIDKVLALKESNPQSPTQELEQEIDSLVYTLYNLTEEEIKIIEKSRNG